MSYACSKVDFPHRLCISKLQITHAWVIIEMHVWGMKLLKLDFCKQEIRYGLQNLTQHY